MLLFLLGCSKSNHDTIAFVGDENEMKTCYELYPEQYFPSGISQELKDGKFPPDLVGEYEMHGSLIDDAGSYYNPLNPQLPMPLYHEPEKSLCFIVEDQINGMAKITVGVKHNGTDYQWNDATDAYIYGNVYDEGNSKKFMLCYQNIVGDDNTPYKNYNGNIITGTLDKDGIKNVDYWYVVKQVTLSSPNTIYPIEGSYAHYHADIAVIKSK